MKKIFDYGKKHLISLLFLICLGTFFLGSFPEFTKQVVQEACRRITYGGGAFISLTELFEDTVPYQDMLVQVNGGFAKWMGLRRLNERYLLDDGQLTYVVPEVDTQPGAQQTAALRDILAQQGIPMTYVCTPFKVNPQHKGLPAGVEDYSNENADAFLEAINEAGVDSLDLRESILEQGLNYTDMFYFTDHHWRAEYGLWATGEIVKHLTAVDDSFQTASELLNPENFRYTLHSEAYYGSASERVGKWYHAPDKMTVVEPKYETAMDFSMPKDNLQRSGTFREAVLFEEHPGYAVYCDKISDLTVISNDSAEKGLPLRSTPKKLLLIADSFSLVVQPFLTLAYDEVAALDLRLYEGNLMDYIGSYAPDYVLVIYNPGVFHPENAVMLEFIK